MRIGLIHLIVALLIPTYLIYIFLRLLFIKKFKLKIKYEVIRLIFLAYLICSLSILWFNPVPNLEHVPLNIIPFKTIISYFLDYWGGNLSFFIMVSNLLGNVLLTLPLGFFIYIKNKNLSFKQILLISFFTPLIIELVQLSLHFLQLGTRIVDIDDIILNMLGIVSGYYLVKFLFYRDSSKLKVLNMEW